MSTLPSEHDVVVVGAGPAGLAAAAEAASSGLTVALVDAGTRAGGQYWRQPDGPALQPRAHLHHDLATYGRLTETIDRYNADFSQSAEIGLIGAFLNPMEYESSGLTPGAATGGRRTPEAAPRGRSPTSWPSLITTAYPRGAKYPVSPIRLPSLSRHRPIASKFSSPKPIGSI